MHNLVSVSKAAKLVGASRIELQNKIQHGQLKTFEGQVSRQALKKAYPQVSFEDDSQIERLQRIQENALSKSLMDMQTTEQSMKFEVQKLRYLLDQSNEELIFYKNLTCELKNRLSTMQADCTHRQKLMLQALLTWMGSQINRKGHH